MKRVVGAVAAVKECMTVQLAASATELELNLLRRRMMTMSKEALKLALEALKKLGDYPHAFDECTNAIKALEEALNHCEDKLNMVKQEQGEPVGCWCHKCNENKTVNGLPLAMTRMILCPECGNKRCPKASNHALQCTNSNEPNQVGSVYTTPQQRTWVGLTDEEIWQLVNDCVLGGDLHPDKFAQSIEDKLRSKNNG
jgi:hypothetical protein